MWAMCDSLMIPPDDILLCYRPTRRSCEHECGLDSSVWHCRLGQDMDIPMAVSHVEVLKKMESRCCLRARFHSQIFLFIYDKFVHAECSLRTLIQIILVHVGHLRRMSHQLAISIWEKRFMSESTQGAFPWGRE